MAKRRCSLQWSERVGLHWRHASSLRSKRFHLVSEQRKTGFGRARNEMRPLSSLLLVQFFARSLTLVPRSLLLNRTETLATQATTREMTEIVQRVNEMALNETKLPRMKRSPCLYYRWNFPSNILKIIKSTIMLKMYRSPCLTPNLTVSRFTEKLRLPCLLLMKSAGQPVYREAQFAVFSYDVNMWNLL